MRTDDIRNEWTVGEGQVREWIDALVRSGRRVVAPVERDGLRLYRAVRSAGDVALNAGKAAWSPKEFLFPRTESLFRYEVRGDDIRLEEAPRADEETVLFGVAPCDAAGMARAAAILGGDPAFTARRAGTTVVALACSDTDASCFCTAVGGAPDGEDGSDLLLLPADGGFLLRALTERGAALAGESSSPWAPATDGARAAAAALARRVADRIGRGPIAREWAEGLSSRFDAPDWAALARRCVGCSVCTYVCPSCTCFDVNEVGTASCGERCRTWDSCTFGQFTRHASGHNPRPDQAARFRQRVLHKFSYFPRDHGGAPMCVGCGRCVSLCPVGLDIHEAVHRVMAGASGGNDASR